MTNEEPDVLVQRFVDGDLTEAEVRPALHRIADDAEARDLLQFELRMTQDLAASRSTRPPEDFAARTMEAVSEVPTPGDEPASIETWLRQWWDRLVGPVSVQVRPVSAVVAVLLAGVGAWMVAGPLGPAEAPESAPTASSESASVQQASAASNGRDGRVWIRFMYTNNEADSVAVAGDFSQWEPVPLSPRTVDGETVWTGLVPVSRGEHEYQFLINGEQWIPDPLAPVKRSDGFGARNAVLNV